MNDDWWNCSALILKHCEDAWQSWVLLQLRAKFTRSWYSGYSQSHEIIKIRNFRYLFKLPTSFPGSFISPPQRERGKKEGAKGWSHVLVTNLSSSEGVPIYQSIVAAAVCYLLNRLFGQPWKALFQFRSEDLSYQVHCFQHLKLNWVWKLWKDKNVKL